MEIGVGVFVILGLVVLVRALADARAGDGCNASAKVLLAMVCAVLAVIVLLVLAGGR